MSLLTGEAEGLDEDVDLADFLEDKMEFLGTNRHGCDVTALWMDGQAWATETLTPASSCDPTSADHLQLMSACQRRGEKI